MDGQTMQDEVLFSLSVLIRGDDGGVFTATYEPGSHDRLLNYSGDRNRKLHHSTGTGLVMGWAHLGLITQGVSIALPEWAVSDITIAMKSPCFVGDKVQLEVIGDVDARTASAVLSDETGAVPHLTAEMKLITPETAERMLRMALKKRR